MYVSKPFGLPNLSTSIYKRRTTENTSRRLTIIRYKHLPNPHRPHPTAKVLSIPIDDPQTPPRIQQHPNKTRLRPPHQILTTRIRRTVPPHRHRQRRPTRHARVATTALAATGADAATPVGGVLAQAIGREQKRGFFGAAAVGTRGGALGHGDVVLVEHELAAVDPGAETEVGGEDGEEAGDDAGDDGGDVGTAALFRGGGVAGRAGGGGLGDGGAVGAGDGVGDWLSGCEGAIRGCFGGGGDGGSAGAGAADDGLYWSWDLVAVAAAEAGGAFRLGGLLVLGVSSAESCELILPLQFRSVEDIDAG